MKELQPRQPVGNKEIALVLDDISRLLEVKRDSLFKIRAYHNAARSISSYPVELREVVAHGGNLRDVPGVGEAIAAKATELVTTGTLEYYEKLKKSFAPGVLDLLRVPGISARAIDRLVNEHGITSVDALEAALRSGNVAGSTGTDEKTAQSWMSMIQAYRQGLSDGPSAT